MGSGPAVGSVRARYLVYFQYLGTDFNGVAAVRGAQRAVGVQNYLEEAAERLKSVVPVKFIISSRTDAGVHALSNAAHLDVQRRSGQPPFSPEVLTEALNTHLRHPAIRCAPPCSPSPSLGRGGRQKGLCLDRTSGLIGQTPRVLQAFRVPGDFHARYAATSRTYLYRLATGCPRPDQLPVFERNRCWALRADYLDVAAMREAAQHLLGTHDFRAFQSAGSPSTSSVRTLRQASVSPGPGSPFVLPQESRRLRFWTLEFESKSFLYRQVRRMTAILVAVGLGALTPTEVKVILESRDPLGKHQTRVAPAHGLFLKSVLYGGLGDLGKRRLGTVPACTPLTDPLSRLGLLWRSSWWEYDHSPCVILATGNPACAQQEGQGPGDRGPSSARRPQQGDHQPKGRQPAVLPPAALKVLASGALGSVAPKAQVTPQMPSSAQHRTCAT